MDNSPTNPLYVTLFFVLRCLVPLGIMLGISYLLKKLGLVSKPPTPPTTEELQPQKSNHHDGGLSHA